MLEARPPPGTGLPQLPRSPSLHAALNTPVDLDQVHMLLTSCPYSLPHLIGGSASTTLLSRPAQVSLALRPAKDRKRTRLNSSHGYNSYAGFCLKKKKRQIRGRTTVPLSLSIDLFLSCITAMDTSLYEPFTPLQVYIPNRSAANISTLRRTCRMN